MSDIDSIYARWLEGDLSPEEISNLKASGEWTELESIIASTSDLRMPAYHKELEYAKLQKSLKGGNPSIFPIRRLLSLAASLALLITAFFLYQNKSYTIKANQGENRSYQLADNSEILLNDGSSFSYKQRKYNKERTIELTGEAFFNVKKGSSFKVLTKNGDIAVLGTSFNVRSWGEKLYVQCHSGKVKVSSGSQNAILTEGMAVHLGPQNRKDIINGLSNSKPLWMNGNSSFLNEDITIVLDEIGRQFNVTISYPEQLAISQGISREFTGQFSHADKNEALEMVCKPMGLEYEVSSDGKNILIK